MKPRPETWHITRSRTQHFTPAEIQIIAEGYKIGRSCREVACELHCAIRTVNNWYAKLKKGWVPGNVKVRPGSDVIYYAPVPKRQMPAPNALPWCLPKLTARRA